MQTILKEWRTVIIGVNYYVPKPANFDPRWDQFLGSVLGRKDRAFNPFSRHERIALWEACIREHKLEDRVSCQAFKPPYFDPNLNIEFPASRYDYVVAYAEPHETFDYWRQGLQAEILQRQVFLVHPPWKLHVTEIRKRIARGEQWSDYIAPGTHGLFEKYQGSERLTPRGVFV